MKLYDNLDEMDGLDTYNLDNDASNYANDKNDSEEDDSNFENYHNYTRNNTNLLLKQYKNEALQAKSMVHSLKHQMNQIIKDNKKLKEERKYLYNQIDTKTAALEQSKKRLTNVTKVTEDTKQKLRDESGHQYELEKENQRLVLNMNT